MAPTYSTPWQIGGPIVASPVPIQMGGKPNPGTKKDRRLKENRPKRGKKNKG